MPALDGLRGVAVGGVLLFHTGHLDGGFLGVDLFLVLSGYLITDLLLREVRTTGRIDLVAFWGRRARRLLPALVTLLVVVTVTARLTAPDDVVRAALADGPWVQAHLVNWHLVAEEAGYWDRFGPGRVFGHLWSVAVEEQFYLAWPLLVLVAAASARHRAARTRRGAAAPADHAVALAAGVLGLASVGLMAALVDPADPTRVYVGTDTRASALLLGALVATAPVRTLLARVPRARATAAAGLTLVASGVAWVLVDGTATPGLFRGGLLAHSAAAALLVGCVAHGPATAVTRGLASRPLRALGLVSYSLYLWHWPVVVLVDLTTTPGWARTGVVLVGSCALAALSTRLVENPVRFRARWARGRRGALVLAAATAGLAALWLVVPEPPAPVVDVGDLT